MKKQLARLILCMSICLLINSCNIYTESDSSNVTSHISESTEGIYTTTSFSFNSFDEYLDFYHIYKEHNIARFLMPKFGENVVIYFTAWHVPVEFKDRNDINFGDNEGWYSLEYKYFDNLGNQLYIANIYSLGTNTIDEFDLSVNESGQKYVFAVNNQIIYLSIQFSSYHLSDDIKNDCINSILNNSYLGVEYVY